MLPKSWFMPRSSSLRLENAPSSFGIDPLSWLFLRNRTTKLKSLPIGTGIWPERRLLERDREDNFERAPRSAGMVPLKAFPLIEKASMPAEVVNPTRISPIRELFARKKLCRLLSEVYEQGMLPVKYWLLRSGVCKLTQFLSSTRRFPDGWFPLKSRNWRCQTQKMRGWYPTVDFFADWKLAAHNKERGFPGICPIRLLRAKDKMFNLESSPNSAEMDPDDWFLSKETNVRLTVSPMPVGMEPENWLEERETIWRAMSCVRFKGIDWLRLFSCGSRICNIFKLKMEGGMVPKRRFCEKFELSRYTIYSGNCFTALLLLLPYNCKSLLLLLELGIVVRYFTQSPKLSFQSAWLLCLVVSYVSWAMLFGSQKVLISSSSSFSPFPLVFKFWLLPFKIVSTTSL